jgi:magnesium chelatase family protein
LSLRLLWRPYARVPLHPADDSALRLQDFRPLLDRIDIHIEVPAVKYKELRAPSSAEDSAAVRQRVIDARNRQTERYRADKKTYSNAQMMPKMIRKYCAITAEGEKLLENAITRLGLSARAHDRILKVARTIADLDAAENIEPRHLTSAYDEPPVRYPNNGAILELLFH